MAVVLRDHGEGMILPALEIYTQGLMTDAAMYGAFVAKQEAEMNFAPEGASWALGPPPPSRCDSSPVAPRPKAVPAEAEHRRDSRLSCVSRLQVNTRTFLPTTANVLF